MLYWEYTILHPITPNYVAQFIRSPKVIERFNSYLKVMQMVFSYVELQLHYIW